MSLGVKIYETKTLKDPPAEIWLLYNLMFCWQEEKSSKEEAPKNIYMFEGHDYSKETSAGDLEAFEALIKCKSFALSEVKK